jgi:hypothetical protein
MAMTADEVRALVLSFPNTEEGTAYGHPAFKAFGKFFTRIRAEDDSLVLTAIGFDEREMLMEADPETFHITPHYRNYPAVLARLSKVDPETVRGLLDRRWREAAPKKLLKSLESAAAHRPFGD